MGFALFDPGPALLPAAAFLLAAAAGRSRSLLAMTYPRERPYWRVAMYLMNVVQRLRRDPFRVFLHPVEQMDEVLATINEKLVRRHPHVFGDVRASTAEEALKSWLSVKEKEREAGR